MSLLATQLLGTLRDINMSRYYIMDERDIGISMIPQQAVVVYLSHVHTHMGTPSYNMIIVSI